MICNLGGDMLPNCGLTSFWGLAVGMLADRVTHMELLASSG